MGLMIGVKVALTQEQRNTLSILGYLYYRMGRLDNAATVFAALDKLAPKAWTPFPGGPPPLSRPLKRIAAMPKSPPAAAQGHGRATLSTRHAALHLLGHALWQQGRRMKRGPRSANTCTSPATARPRKRWPAPFNSMGKRV
ncbi:MAG: hypothetical protein ACLSAH_10245 [Bilophila wadsworthia]